MIKKLLLTSLLFLSVNSHASNIDATMRNCVFLASNDTAYVETQFTVSAKNLKFVLRNDKKWEASVEVTLLYMRDSGVFKHLKYLLFSEAIADTSNNNFNLTDLKRVSLPNGEFSVEIYLEDYNQKTTSGYITEGISINYKTDSLSFSDIELVENYSESKEKSIYTKRGYEIQPYTIQYYPTALSKLTFYAEIYNTDKYFQADIFLSSIYIRESLTGKPMEHFIFNAKQSPEKIKVLFSSFDISGLPTGAYFLTIELRNKKNEHVAEQNIYFIRTNTSITFNPKLLDSVQVENNFSMNLPADSLNFYVQSLYPIASNDEHNYISYFKKSNDDTAMSAFLYKFWIARNAHDPLTEWMNYKKLVYEAESNFKTQTRHGYNTDRGIIFLKYGAPAQINKRSQEPGTYPYEIWHYYFLDPNQSNVHFIFYNTDLVSNNYKLLHSNAIGEIKNPRWQYILNDAFKNKKGINNTDLTDYPDSFGSHADDFMK